MKKQKWVLTLMLLAALAIILVACGDDSGVATQPEQETAASQPEPAATAEASPTPAPTDTTEPEPTDTPELEPSAAESGLDLDDVGMPDDLSSYRSRMRLSTTGTGAEGETGGVLEFLVEYTREPLAQHIVISGEGFDQTDEVGSMEMYQVEGTSYVKLGDQWMSMPATEDVLDDAGMIDPEDMLQGTCGWQHAGSTDYNGIAVQYWTLSEDDLRACIADQELTEMGEITDASGKVYVAEEGNYIVYMELAFEGSNLAMGTGSGEEMVDQGRIEFTYEMTDVNAPITIELPEEASASSDLPEDIPVPEDAEEVSFMFGMINFDSASSPADVADFYQAQMPQNGWSESSVNEMSGMYMLEYTKDGRTASLIINAGEGETGGSSVVITVQEDGS
jgi:hypothetical protein